MSNPTLEDGAVFASRYRVVRCMARGGMGAVYEVVHLGTNRRRALKVMHPHILHSEDLRERFHREAKVAAEVESDFIVDVFDAGIDDATEMPFLCMELLRGEELSRRLRRLGRIPPEELALHIHQTALALDRMHQAGIVHRDLKPENLFITEGKDGPSRIKVLDFGIAKVIADGVNSGPATLSVGTPLYMSPEQFQAHGKLTGASDVYALGMIAYTCLTGAPYWDDEARIGNIFAFGALVMKGPPEPASARAAKRGVTLPPGFDEWFATITSVAPERRFSPATAAARALSEVLGAAVGPAPRAPSSPLLTPPATVPAPEVDAPTVVPVSPRDLRLSLPNPAPQHAAPETEAVTVFPVAPRPVPRIEAVTVVPAPKTAAPEAEVLTIVSGSARDVVQSLARETGAVTPVPASPPAAPEPAATDDDILTTVAARPSGLPDDPAETDNDTMPRLFEDDEGQTLVYKPTPDAKAALLAKVEAHRQARRAAAAGEAAGRPQGAANARPTSPALKAPPAPLPPPNAPARTPAASPAPLPLPAPQAAASPGAPRSPKPLTTTDVIASPLKAPATAATPAADAGPEPVPAPRPAMPTSPFPQPDSSESVEGSDGPRAPRPAAFNTLTPSGAVLPAPAAKPSDPSPPLPSFPDEPLEPRDRGAKWRIIAAIGVAAFLGIFVAAIAMSGPSSTPAGEPAVAATPTVTAPATTSATTAAEAPATAAPSPPETPSAAPTAEPSASAPPAATGSATADPSSKPKPLKAPGPRSTGRPKYTQE